MGIPTVSVLNFRAHARFIKPPRVVLVPYTFGSQWGPPGDVARQNKLIDLVLNALMAMTRPGAILDAAATLADMNVS